MLLYIAYYVSCMLQIEKNEKEHEYTCLSTSEKIPV